MNELTAHEIEEAVGMLGAMKYFPSNESAKHAVMLVIRDMVATREQLTWLVSTLLNRVTEWPGPAQMRALFCTRYAPADGLDVEACTLVGFTPEDGERRSIEEHQERLRLEASRQPLAIAGDVSQDAECCDLVARCAVQTVPAIRVRPEDRAEAEAWARKRGL